MTSPGLELMLGKRSAWGVVKVGVAVTAWNYGRFLGACLDSLAAQTYPLADVIVADDASTDDTAAVADAWFRENGFVKQNQAVACYRANATRLGVVRNMNAALATLSAAGLEWLCVVSADDWLEPAFLERHVALIREHDERTDPHGRRLGFVFGGMRIRCDPGVERMDLDGRVVAGLDGFDGELLRFSNYVPGSAVFRAEAWASVGGFRDTDTDRGEDHQFWLDLWRSEKWFGYGTTDVLVNWRRHNAGHRNQGADLRTRRALTSRGLGGGVKR